MSNASRVSGGPLDRRVVPLKRQLCTLWAIDMVQLESEFGSQSYQFLRQLVRFAVTHPFQTAIKVLNDAREFRINGKRAKGTKRMLSRRDWCPMDVELAFAAQPGQRAHVSPETAENGLRLETNAQQVPGPPDSRLGQQPSAPAQDEAATGSDKASRPRSTGKGRQTSLPGDIGTRDTSPMSVTSIMDDSRERTSFLGSRFLIEGLKVLCSLRPSYRLFGVPGSTSQFQTERLPLLNTTTLIRPTIACGCCSLTMINLPQRVIIVYDPCSSWKGAHSTAAAVEFASKYLQGQYENVEEWHVEKIGYSDHGTPDCGVGCFAYLLCEMAGFGAELPLFLSHRALPLQVLINMCNVPNMDSPGSNPAAFVMEPWPDQFDDAESPASGTGRSAVRENLQAGIAAFYNSDAESIRRIGRIGAFHKIIEGLCAETSITVAVEFHQDQKTMLDNNINAAEIMIQNCRYMSWPLFDIDSAESLLEAMREARQHSEWSFLAAAAMRHGAALFHEIGTKSVDTEKHKMKEQREEARAMKRVLEDYLDCADRRESLL